MKKSFLNERPRSSTKQLFSRLADSDVAEHIRAVFVPLIRAKTTTTEQRIQAGEAISLASWKAFQVTHSERHPVLGATHTLFNLVPCNRELEVAMTNFADRAPDIAAFAKNAGPQALRIDYLAAGGRLAFYSPDFFARAKDGRYYLIETKGQEDRDVPRKARAAIAWCESASTPSCPWEYVYVPQGVFGRLSGNSIAELARTSSPSLQYLLEEPQRPDQMTIFDAMVAADDQAPELKGFVDDDTLAALPPRYKKAVEQATMLFRFFENKEGMNYSPVFNALLGSIDEAARGLLIRRLQSDMPVRARTNKLGSMPISKMWTTAGATPTGAWPRTSNERLCLRTALPRLACYEPPWIMPSMTAPVSVAYFRQ